MSIVELIKSERKMSFNHWRYRLLHWSFGIEPSKPEESKLPRFLYTHYCPLFHLTNILLLVLPIVLLAKGIWGVVNYLGEKLHCLLEGLDEWFVTRFPPRPSPEVTLEMEVMQMLGRLEASAFQVFDKYWEYFALRHKHLTREQAEVKHAELLQQLKDAIAAKKEEEKQFKDSITYWINFSRVFFRCGLFFLYALIAFCLVYFLWRLLLVVSAIVLLIATVAMLATGVVFAVFYVGKYILGTSSGSKWGPIVKDALCGALDKTCGFFKRAWQVLSIFYEDNCPPITIVSATEEQIERVVENGQEAS